MLDRYPDASFILKKADVSDVRWSDILRPMWDRWVDPPPYVHVEHKGIAFGSYFTSHGIRARFG